MPIRLVLADDHPLILSALENLFQLEADIQVLARCRDGEETLQAVRHHRPDVLILDIRMPGKDGLAVLQELHQEGLPTRVILLTAAVDENTTMRVLRLGVSGIVLKEMAPHLLVSCVHKVHAGGQWLEHRSVSHALDRLMRREAEARERAGVLTPREVEITRLVASGLRNKDIAARLFISEGTVKVHLHSIYEKLHIDSRLALLRYAQDREWD
jgi:DNA-binding NarL/FixJ family response regulator